MGRSAFGWNNRVMTAALTVGSAAANMGAGNLQVDQGSPEAAWQTVAGILTDAAGAWLLIDSGSASSTWRGFGLFRTNLTANATVRWRVSDSLSGGRVTSATYDSGTVPAAVAAGYLQTLTIPTSDATGRYCEVDINDSGNPDNFINVPLAFAGPLFIPQIGVAWSSTFARTDRTDEVVTLGGQEFPTHRYAQRQNGGVLNGAKASEVWPGVMELDRVSRLGGNVLFVLDTTSANLNYETVFGRVRSPSPLSFPVGAADARAWAATFTERL